MTLATNTVITRELVILVNKTVDPVMRTPLTVNGTRIKIESVNEHENILGEYDKRQEYKSQILNKSYTCDFYDSLDSTTSTRKEIDLSKYVIYQSLAVVNKQGYTPFILKNDHRILVIFFGDQLERCYDLGFVNTELNRISFHDKILLSFLNRKTTNVESSTCTLDELAKPSEANCHYYIQYNPFAVVKITNNCDIFSLIHIDRDTAYFADHYKPMFASTSIKVAPRHTVVTDDVVIAGCENRFAIYDTQAKAILQTVMNEIVTVLVRDVPVPTNKTNPLIDEIVSEMIPSDRSIKSQVDTIIKSIMPMLKRREPVTVAKNNQQVLDALKIEFDKYPDAFVTELVDGILSVIPI